MLMSEVRDSSGTNGFTAAGSFSGAGGSSIGLKLAGFDVRYACEFDEHASDAYRLNWPETRLDTRSIAAVSGDEIVAACGGVPDLWEGSPPCSKFSRSGQGSKSWGKVTQSDSSRKVRNVEDLFFEWIRLLDEIKPRVAVAENVASLAMGDNKGYLLDILDGCRSAGYQTKVWKLDASSFGVPQIRRRLFVVAWDPDRANEPALPTKHDSTLDAASVIEGLATIAAPVNVKTTDMNLGPLIPPTSTIYKRTLSLAPGQSDKDRFNLMRAHPDRPVPTITAQSHDSVTLGSLCHWENPPRRFSVYETQRLTSWPDDYEWPPGSTWSDIGHRLGNSVPPLLAAAVYGAIRQALESPV